MRRRWSISFLAAILLVFGTVTGVAITSAAAAVAEPGGSFHPVAPARILDTRVGLGAPKSALSAQATLPLTVLGVGGVPTDGVGTVVLNLRVTQPSASGAIVVYADGDPRPKTVAIFYRAGETSATTMPVRVSASGKVLIYNNSAGTVHVIADVTGYYSAGAGTAPGTFTPIPSLPLLNSKIGLGSPAGPLAAHATLTVDLNAVLTSPSPAIGTVTLRVGVANPSAPGALVLHKHGSTQPVATSVDFVAGQTVSSLVITEVDADRKFDLVNTSGGALNVYADVLGYTAAQDAASAGAFHPIDPTLAVDTALAPAESVAAVAPNTVPAPGHYLGPDFRSPVSALLLRVTASSAEDGTVTVFSTEEKPAYSSVTVTAGRSSSNVVVLPYGNTDGWDAGHAITVVNNGAAAATVTVTVLGFYAAQSESGVSGSIAGRVTDTQGNPLTGVDIEFDRNIEDGPYAAHVYTDADGRYLMPALDAGKAHTVCIGGGTASIGGGTASGGSSPRGYVDECILDALPTYDVVAGQVTVINTALISNAAASGVVTDAAGNPLHDISVLVDAADGNPDHTYAATTDANGVWLVDRMVPSTGATACAHTLEGIQSNGGISDRAGYLPSCYQAQGRPTFPVPAGALTRGIDQSLAAGGAVSGTLLSADGSPCSQCYISAWPLSDPAVSRQVSDPSDEAGAYLIRSMPAGSYQISFGGQPDQDTYPTPITVVPGQVVSGIDGRLT